MSLVWGKRDCFYPLAEFSLPSPLGSMVGSLFCQMHWRSNKTRRAPVNFTIVSIWLRSRETGRASQRTKYLTHGAVRAVMPRAGSVPPITAIQSTRSVHQLATCAQSPHFHPQQRGESGCSPGSRTVAYSHRGSGWPKSPTRESRPSILLYSGAIPRSF